MSCIQDCGFLSKVGPPPNLIVDLPPPPFPSFLQNSADFLFANNNGSCDFCNWAQGLDVPYIKVSRKGRSFDETAFFIAISACISVVIVTILFVVFIFRCKEAKVKPVPELFGKRLVTNNILSNTSSDTTLYANNSGDAQAAYNPTPQQQPKIMWSGLGNAGTSPYVLQHQPVNLESPELLSHYEYIDYGSVGHTYVYPVKVVHIMNDVDNAAHEKMVASFENCGFIDSESRATTL